LAGTRDWGDTKRQGTVLLKVLMTNKSQTKDLKIWYRLCLKHPEDADSQNVTLAVSSRKTYLNAKNQKQVLTLVKIDPSVPYFFKNIEELQVELETTVRNPDGPEAGTGAARRVRHAQQSQDAGGSSSTGLPYGINMSNVAPMSGYDEDDREDRDDDAAYAAYQAQPQYSGYGGHASAEEEQLHLLALQQPQGGDAEEEGRGDGSTDAVADGHNAGGSRQGSDDGELPDLGLEAASERRCPRCQALSNAAFNCDSCGEYLGPAEMVGDDDQDFM
jgi:hypothetical protein